MRVGDVYCWANDPRVEYTLVTKVFSKSQSFTGVWSHLNDKDTYFLGTSILGQFSHMIGEKIKFSVSKHKFAGNIRGLSESIKEMLFSPDLDTRKYAYEIIKANSLK